MFDGAGVASGLLSDSQSCPDLLGRPLCGLFENVASENVKTVLGIRNHTGEGKSVKLPQERRHPVFLFLNVRHVTVYALPCQQREQDSNMQLSLKVRNMASGRGNHVLKKTNDF